MMSRASPAIARLSRCDQQRTTPLGIPMAKRCFIVWFGDGVLQPLSSPYLMMIFTLLGTPQSFFTFAQWEIQSLPAQRLMQLGAGVAAWAGLTPTNAEASTALATKAPLESLLAFTVSSCELRICPRYGL